MRKIILSTIGILFMVGSFLLAQKIIADKNRPKRIKEKIVKTVFTDTVNNQTIKIVIPANGSLVAKRRIEIYAEVQGVFRATNVSFKPGQKYRKGQALIRIDAAEYTATVQAAKSDLYNSVAAIMPDLRLDFPDVFPKWQAYLNNFNLNQVTPKLPKTTSNKEHYFITGRGIVSSYYSVKNLEQRLQKYNIYAPFSGVLIEALVTEGSLIRSGQRLGAFIDTSVYEMEVALSKNYATLLKVGETVALTNLDKTERFSGTVSRVNGSVDPTTQTIAAFIDVKSDVLKEGMFLEARLNAKEVPNAIEVNRSLLLENNEIFIIRDGVLDVIEVNPVYFSETKAVLKSVPNGTVILKKPIPGAYAGMLVKPFNKLNNRRE